MAIRDWSTTAANNNSAAPNGAPEGMAPSGVNNTIREVMAQVRTWYEDPGWVDYGNTPTRVDNDTITVATDLTARYVAGRRVKLVGATTGYGTISSSSYSAPDTTVNITMDSGNVPTSLVTVSLGLETATGPILPYYNRTPAETSAGVTPTNYQYAPADQAHGDLRRFGTVGGVDVTTALQTAITAISGYGTINIPYGTNYITGQLNIGARVVRIRLNRGTLQVNSNITGHVFSCASAGGKLILEDGILDGNDATYTVNGNAVLCDGSAMPEFYGVTIQNFKATSGSDYPGVGVYTKSNCTGKMIAQDSDVIGCHGGWYIRGATGSKCVFRNSGASDNTISATDTPYPDSSTGYAAILGALASVEVFGGTWDNNAAGGVSHYTSTATPGKHGRFIGLQLSNNKAFGFYNGQGTKYVSLIGSTFEDNEGGIDTDPILNDGVTPADMMTAIVGNVVSGGAGSFMGVRVNGAIGVVLAANVIEDPASNGAVYALGSSDKTLVASNLLIGTNSFLQVNNTANRVYHSGNLPLGLSGNPPFLPTSSGYILEAGTAYSGTYPSSPTGLPSPINTIDTSGSSKAPELPVSRADGIQLVTFIKTAAANTMTVTRSGSDVITKLDGTTANTEAFTNITCVTYRAITGGWIRVQ